jgi:hypothetical protein
VHRRFPVNQALAEVPLHLRRVTRVQGSKQSGYQALAHVV